MSVKKIEEKIFFKVTKAYLPESFESVNQREQKRIIPF